MKPELSKQLGFGRINTHNTKVRIVIGITVAGVLILAETRQRCQRLRERSAAVKDFGAFVERFKIAPSPQPRPPAARHPLADLTFAISDNFEVKGFVSGFGNLDWARTHEPAVRTAEVVACLLKHGAMCVGRTLMDDLAFGLCRHGLLQVSKRLLQQDQEFTFSSSMNVVAQLVRRAERAGFKAIALTVDTPRLGRREADIKNRFVLPLFLTLKNFEGLDLGKIDKTSDSGLASYVAGQIDRTLSWKDVKWLQTITTMLILVKGVITAEDTRLAIQAGAAGIIVSNHGARQLDYVPRLSLHLKSITGENLHYGTPVNQELPSQIPGGSCSGSAVVVELVDFVINVMYKRRTSIIKKKSRCL